MLTCTYCSTAEEVGGQGYKGQFQSNSRSAPVTSPSGVCLLSWLWRVRNTCSRCCVHSCLPSRFTEKRKGDEYLLVSWWLSLA